MVPTPSILVARNFSYLLLRVQQPWCVQSSLQQQQQLVLLRNKQPNTPETSSRWHCQPMGTGSTCSPEDFHHLPMSRLFCEFKSTSLKKSPFGWIWLVCYITLLFRKTSANSHTRFTFHLAVFVGNRIIVNGPPSGFSNTKWHHISGSSEAHQKQPWVLQGFHGWKRQSLIIFSSGSQ